MDEVLELCRRLIGDDRLAEKAAEQARGRPDADRVQQFGAAILACRGADLRVEPDRRVRAQGLELGEAVSEELRLAVGSLPERQREVLALRELLGLSHDQAARILEFTPAAVAMLLARARLGLRFERRGPLPEPDAGCPERERALRSLARRQDSEQLGREEEDWLMEHLGQCLQCSRSHAAMLEASVCYRAWRPSGEQARAHA